MPRPFSSFQFTFLPGDSNRFTMWILLLLYVSLFLIGRLCPRRVPGKLRSLLFISISPQPPTPASSDSDSDDSNSKYDVFISFRGADVRENFFSHLYSYLNDNRKLRVYRDDSDLERGCMISPSILDAIERSEAYIVIFSPGYADSEWCLEELVKILECGETYGRKVIPVFYGGVDPSHVENLTGSYRKLPVAGTSSQIRSWRAAMTTAASFSGFDSRVIRPESKLCEEIFKAVLQVGSNEMAPVSYLNDGLVGVERRMNQIEIQGFGDNPTIGLWGMGGIGKTTLAKAFYDRFSPQFEASYFFSNFSDQQYDTNLQNELFSKLLVGDAETVRIIPLNLRMYAIGFMKSTLRMKLKLFDYSASARSKSITRNLVMRRLHPTRISHQHLAKANRRFNHRPISLRQQAMAPSLLRLEIHQPDSLVRRRRKERVDQRSDPTPPRA